MRRKKPVNIFEYLDYRQYLNKFYSYQKENTRKFTFRSFAKEANVASSLLKDIISGRQNLTLGTMEKYAKAMGLTKKETAYFSLLVRYNNSKQVTEKNTLLDELVRMRGRSQIKVLTSRQYEYFSKWYHAVVREMVTQKGIGDDPEAISKAITPPVTSYRIRKSIELLKELDLIYQDEFGTWCSRDRMIASEHQIHSLSLKNYHNEMIELGRQGIERFPSESREIQGLTLSCSEKLYEEIKKRVRFFSKEILQLVAQEECTSEKVFQLNLQLFPFNVDDEEVQS